MVGSGCGYRRELVLGYEFPLGFERLKALV